MGKLLPDRPSKTDHAKIGRDGTPPVENGDMETMENAQKPDAEPEETGYTLP